jgi:hypothetical protein
VLARKLLMLKIIENQFWGVFLQALTQEINLYLTFFEQLNITQ